MGKSCYLCDRKASKLEGVSLFLFPKEPIARAKWIKACDLLPSDNLKNTSICSMHFNAKDLDQGNQFRIRSTLRRGAVPSIDIPGVNNENINKQPLQKKEPLVQEMPSTELPSRKYFPKNVRTPIVKEKEPLVQEMPSTELPSSKHLPKNVRTPVRCGCVVEAHGKSKDRLELNASNNYSLQSNLETGSVVEVYSSEQSNFSSYCDSGKVPLVQEMPSTELPSSKHLPKNVRTPVRCGCIVEAHGKSKDRLELNASNSYSLQSNLETGSVVEVYSSEQSNFSSYCDSEKEPLVQEMPSTELPSSKHLPTNVRTGIFKVLGKQNFKDSKVQEILDKVRLKKKGSVLPLKKKCNENKLTKDKIKSIIRNLPEIDPNLKDRLLTSLSDKKYVPLKCLSPVTKDTAKAKNHCKKRNLNRCSCSIHCVKKRFKKQRPIVLTPSLHIKIDGSDLGQNDSEDRQFQSAEKLFSVSTLLANIYDKEQIERLCQLVIESIFKLKNININGTMSKIEIYFFNNFKAHILQKSECRIATDSSEVTNNVGSTTTSTSHTAGSYNVGNDSDDQSHPLDREENEVIPNTRLLDKKSEKNQNNDEFSVSPPSRYSRDKQENITQNVKVDLNFYHDHSYISQDSRVLFEKPPYLVNLVNIDTFRSSFKKTRILKRPPPPMTKKVKREFLKLRGQISRLRGILKIKNENMEKEKEKLKYLGSIVCEYKGLKRIRFPNRILKKKDTEILLHKGQDSFKKDSMEIKLKEKKRKKIKFIPDLEIPSLNINSNKLTGCETSEVECDEDLNFFYDSFLEDCIEEG